MAEVVDEPQQHEPQPPSPPPEPKEDKSSTATTTAKEPSYPPPTAATPAPPVSSFYSLSLSIWPPSQRTRTAVLNRLVETLSSPSILSQRYGSLPPDEAAAVARQIEDEAFSLASAATSPENDGMATLQIYSSDISKRMLETVKARGSPSIASSPAPSSASVPVEVASVASDPAPGGASEEISSVGSESSHT